MDCCHTASLISIDQALEKLLSCRAAISECEEILLKQAIGRITAFPIISPLDVPPFANAAMDGYAVRIKDISVDKTVAIAGKALAGSPFQGKWPLESVIRIMTGAPIPEGTEAVVMQELTTETESGVSFNTLPQNGQYIRLAGEDIQQGATVIDAGVRLGATALPLLASLGIAKVTVVRRLKVALFSSGDELQSIGEPLQGGQIYDINRFTIKLMLAQLGYEIIDLGIIHDSPDALRAAFLQGDQVADVIISSGGVSVGEADFIKPLLDELGQISFWKLAIKPGKPFAFGQLKHALFCGLPGNPVSALVTFYQLVQPLLAHLAGDRHWQRPLRMQARTLTALKKVPGRLDFQRGIVSVNSLGELEVRTTGQQDSHIFSSFAQANAFIVLERERGSVAAGEWVNVELFNTLLRP